MAQIEINEARIRAEFGELARIDSESFGERELADRLKEKLTELGIQAKEDDTAEKIGGNAGNLFGTLKGGLPGTPILLSGHMDTVAPGIGKKPVFHEDGTITSDGTTVLGADDLTGVIAILEGIRAVQEAGIPHRDPLCGGGRAVYKRKLGVRFQPDESEGILRFGCNWTSRDSDPAGTDDPFL